MPTSSLVERIPVLGKDNQWVQQDAVNKPLRSYCDKVMEGVSRQQGISGHGPSFRSQGAIFANNSTALESSKVGYPCALTIIRKNCQRSECDGYEVRVRN